MQSVLCRVWDSVPFNLAVLALILSNFVFTVEQVPDRRAEGQAGWPTDRKQGKQADRQADRLTDMAGRQAFGSGQRDRQSVRQKARNAGIQTKKTLGRTTGWLAGWQSR